MHKVCLVIIDGFGYKEKKDKNPIHTANIPFLKQMSQCGYQIYAHGEHVGLFGNQMGNSEVGHLTIGSGRVIYQDLVKIDNSIKTGQLDLILDQKGLINVERLHFVGLISDGGIHSHINHLIALINFSKKRSKNIFIHFIADGRDTEPRCFEKFYKQLENICNSQIKIASIGGRYYAMDRNNNDDRIELAFQSMTSKTNQELIVHPTFDEMISPVLLDNSGSINEEDTIFFFNFRADRMKQIVKRFMNRNKIYTLTNYDDKFNVVSIFDKEIINNTLAETLSINKIKQVHISETEKFAHVTYFLNGNLLPPFFLEERAIVPSPDVKDYSLTPEMSTESICNEIIKKMEQDYPFIVANIASPDMIGHTGNYDATCKAIEITDLCLKSVFKSAIKNSYQLLITADHGNCEEMFDENGNIATKHTCNKVPFICCKSNLKENEEWKLVDSKYGLKDVAPTVLKLMGVVIPKEMEGSVVNFEELCD